MTQEFYPEPPIPTDKLERIVRLFQHYKTKPSLCHAWTNPKPSNLFLRRTKQ